MRIAINTRHVIPGELDGIGKFAYEVATRMAKMFPHHEFHWFFDRPFDDVPIPSSNVIPHRLFPPARHPYLFLWWFEWSVKRELKRAKADVFLSPDGFLSLSSNVPSIPVMHDLNFEHYPQDLPANVRRYYRKYFPKFARKAERIITVSEFSKKDIQEKYGVDPSRIDVVYNGVDPFLQPLEEGDIERVRKEWSDGDPFFIFVGTLHPRKNLSRALRAFDTYRDQGGRVPKFLIVGRSMWWTQEMEDALQGMKHQKDVKFMGRTEDKVLKDLMGASAALVYVSIFEGFGMPILEGMKVGVPVLTSNVTSMPEVGGDAVEYADPTSEESIVNGMFCVGEDPDKRKALIEKGFSRVSNFTWDACVEGVWETIQMIDRP